MNPLASPPYSSSDSSSLASSYPPTYFDPAMRSLLASTWHVLDQPPPPSLREILGAYKSKGDGDRDMLLAMLQAKSAEDQRIASVSSLHRTMLEIHHHAPSPPQLPQLHLPNGPRPSFSPPAHHASFSPTHKRESTSSPKVSLPSIRDHPSSSDSPRKRMRTSHSPSASRDYSAHHDLPPSPYSTSSQRSLSGESTHSQRGSMAIGALLSTNGNECDESWDPRVSSERTCSRAVHEHNGRGHPVSV